MYGQTGALSYLTSIEEGRVGTWMIRNMVQRGNGMPFLFPINLHAAETNW
jgi:hypothetical protein